MDKGMVRALAHQKFLEIVILGSKLEAESCELTLQQIFLLNYKVFLSPLELMERIILIYCTTPSSHTYHSHSQSNSRVNSSSLSSPPSQRNHNNNDPNTQEMLGEGVETQAEDNSKLDNELVPIRIRVLKMIKQWIQLHPYDFEGDQPLASLLISFLDNTVSFTGYASLAASLKQNLASPSFLQSSKTFPPPILPPQFSSSKFKLSEIDPLEVCSSFSFPSFLFSFRFSSLHFLFVSELEFPFLTFPTSPKKR